MASEGPTTRQERRTRLRLTLLGLDTVMVALGTALASLVRFGRIFDIGAIPGLGANVQFVDISLVIVIIWIGSLWFEGLYDVDRIFWGTGEYTRVVRGLSLGVVVFIMATFVLKLPGLSRGWIVLAWAFGILFVVSGRVMVRAALARAQRHGHMLRRTLIVGYNQEAADLIRRLKSDASSGLDPVACLASSREGVIGLQYCNPDVECLGAAGDIKTVLAEHFFDTVLIASTAFDPDVLGANHH